mmetsp:Transcript_16621/g.14468  ORF Transcript_16621/g.14468 Transcript_16621/m.14468 type:complete len:213 (-) Transcript_16621:226-864(-)
MSLLRQLLQALISPTKFSQTMRLLILNLSKKQNSWWSSLRWVKCSRSSLPLSRLKMLVPLKEVSLLLSGLQTRKDLLLPPRIKQFLSWIQNLILRVKFKLMMENRLEILRVLQLKMCLSLGEVTQSGSQPIILLKEREERVLQEALTWVFSRVLLRQMLMMVLLNQSLKSQFPICKDQLPGNQVVVSSLDMKEPKLKKEFIRHKLPSGRRMA